MTAVAAAGYLAKVSEAIVQMLADSATFQTLVGAANAAAAKTRIVEDDAGRSDDEGGVSTAVDGSTFNPATTNWGVVMLGDENPREERALRTTGRSGSFSIMLIIRPSDPTDDPASAKRRARNTASAVADGVQALFGASTSRICGGSCVVSSCSKADAIRSLAGAYVAILDGTWRDVP